MTWKPWSHVRILIIILNVAKHRVMFVHVTFFVVKYFFLNSFPCSYHGLFYGHAMFIGNSQKEARYLSFPVFIAVRFIASKVKNNSRYSGFEPGRAIAPIPQWNLKCPVQKWLRGQFVPLKGEQFLQQILLKYFCAQKCKSWYSMKIQL